MPFKKNCDIIWYANAEYQVTKFIYNLAMNFVTLKCQYLNGNILVIFASVKKFFTILEWDWLIVSPELIFFPFGQVCFSTAT
jgi:hypothetical protein